MKERPILFSGPMVRALLTGAKTQTRRTVKWGDYTAPEGNGFEFGGLDASGNGGLVRGETGGVSIFPLPLSPYGVAGDRLWVRETHAQFSVGEGLDSPVPQCVAYRATCEADGGFDYTNGRGEASRLTVTKWTPSIFMPHWASRITLEVTDVRVERLQDIDPEDAMREGVGDLDFDEPLSSVEAFERLWTSINGADSWAANPFVWVVSFKRKETP